MVAVTENVANFNNTPDLAMHFGVCYLFPPKNQARGGRRGDLSRSATQRVGDPPRLLVRGV